MKKLKVTIQLEMSVPDEWELATTSEGTPVLKLENKDGKPQFMDIAIEPLFSNDPEDTWSTTDDEDTLNDILENWGTEPLSLWGNANDVVNTVAGQATYTIGPGGNFNIDRPVRVNGAYVTVGGVDFTIEVIGQSQFNEIGLKTQQQPIPYRLLYVAEFPLGLITLWPGPSQVVPLTLSTDRLLTQIPTIATTINYPPGAAKALRYALAIELASEYGVAVDPVMASIGADAKADFKRANKQPVLAGYDGALLGSGGYVNWRTGA